MAEEERKEQAGGEAEEQEELPRRKIDVRAALAMIPPASQLLGKEKKARERRVRLRFHDELKKGLAKISPALYKELGGEGEYIEVVVAHRHKFRYRVELDEEVPENEVWVNGSDLPEYGVSDNTIATVRLVKAQ